MKKFISKICLLLLLVIFSDVLFGFVMGKISKGIDLGGVGRDNYICDKVTDDLVIFGSSRAEHHYNTKMMTDSLGIPCYNCGEEGCGIILAYGRLLMLLERYHPKTIVYDLTPDFDFLKGKDNHQYLYRLKQHYDRSDIDSIFWSIDSTEKYKMLSGMYRHNSSFLQNLIVYFLRISTDVGVRGFIPINTEMDIMKTRGRDFIADDSKKGYVYDSLKLSYLNKFIEKSKDVNLVFVISPMWYKQDTLVFEPINKLCKDRKIQLINLSNNPKYLYQNKYFADGTHLNARGADEFTKDLMNELRKRKLIK